MNLHDLVPFAAMILPVVLPRVADAITERLPRRHRDLVAPILGAGLAAAGHAAGLTDVEVAMVFGGGVGAAVWHRFVRAGGRVVEVKSADSHLVQASSLPPKP